MALFSDAFSGLMQVEGKLSKSPDDPGNWTGGAVGKGTLVGTKCGISAASYPELDIPNLSMEQIKAIYKKDFWDAMNLDRIGMQFPRVASMLFNLGVNCGRGNAVRFLQTTINVLNIQEGVNLPAMRLSFWQQKILRLIGGKALKVDGALGPITLSALASIPYPDAVAVGVFGEAYNHYSRGKLMYRAGWLNRIGSLYLK